MKMCRQFMNFMKVSGIEGMINLCCWMKNPIIGRLSENTFDEIWNSDKAKYLREKISQQDYQSVCNFDACPYLFNDNHNDFSKVPLIEVDDIHKFMHRVYMGFETTCNYQCTACFARKRQEFQAKLPPQELEQRYQDIKEKLKEILPHARRIDGNGCGELFASKHTMELMANWKPLAPKNQCSAGIETNGSLFNEKNWKKIENLGQYNLSVELTVMSFNEPTYQILSGTKLPIENLENNLRFVKSLREKNIVNHFIIATVVQQRNFREMPEFCHRCIEEFVEDILTQAEEKI